MEEQQQDETKKQKTEEGEKFFYGKYDERDDGTAVYEILYGSDRETASSVYQKKIVVSQYDDELEWMNFEREAVEKEIKNSFPDYANIRLRGECINNEYNAVATIVHSFQQGEDETLLLKEVKEGVKAASIKSHAYKNCEELGGTVLKAWLLSNFSFSKEEFNDYFLNYELDQYGLTRIKSFTAKYHEILVIFEKTKENKIRITVPGGKRRLGESSFQCAIRELFEETGIDILRHHVLIHETWEEYKSKCRFYPFIVKT